MPDPRDYKLDIAGLSPEPGDGGNAPPGRPFLSVKFACCVVYQRIYRTADGTGYRGHCPKCAKPVRFKVAEGGTSSRFFIVE